MILVAVVLAALRRDRLVQHNFELRSVYFKEVIVFYAPFFDN